MSDEADTLLIVYQRGFADGKKAAQRKPLTHIQAKELVAKYGKDPLNLVFQTEAALRTALEQQAEPICPECKAAVLYECVVCSSNNYPPQQQAEPVAWMDREGDLYKMPEIKNWAPPHTMLYTTSPQIQWAGLTDEEVNRESAPIAQQMKLAFHAGMYVAQQILKEKNGG